jgi:hypothetical protein
MKLEHLIEAYKFKELNVEMIEQEDKAGVIKFTDYIYATYYEDDEIVKSIQVFANTIADKEINNQLEHTINLLKVLSNTIELLTNVNEEVRNMILDTLGLFNNTFKDGKQLQHNNYGYKIEIADGLILFTIGEIDNEEDN